MAIFWKPNGSLDVATDPSDLPESAQDRNIYSEAFARCKNLRLDRKGVVTLRDGSSKFNTTAINTAIYLLIEQGGSRYAFAGANIYKDEASIVASLTSAQWSGIKYNSYLDTTQQIFALNGTDRKRINGTTVNEWGIAAPTVAPTVAAGASTGLTGDYNARYTYIRKVGAVTVSESNPSPAGAAAVTLTNQSFSITWTASGDSQVTHVRVYRTLTGGASYFIDQDIAIGTLTVDTTTTDANLSTALATNHDRPPLGSYVAGPVYDGTCFIIKDNLLYYCLAKQPEYWPSTNFIEVSPIQFPGQLLVFHNGQPYYLTKNKIYYIQGTGSSTFFPLPMESKTGAQGIFGAISVDGEGIYHTGNDGIYLFSGGSDRKITDAAFEPIFRGNATNGVAGVSDMTTAWLHQFENKLYFGYTSTGNTHPTNVLVFDLTTKRVSYYVYNDGSDVQIRCITTDATNNKLIIGDNTGYVRRIEDQTTTTDSGTGIPWEAETKEFTLSTRANFPRWIKYDIDASGSTTATGTVLLDGATQQTHTLSKDRSTKRRLIATGNGERESINLSGTGPIEIYAIEAE